MAIHTRRRSIEQIEKGAKAVALRRRLTYRQIAQQLRMESVSRTYEAVQRGLKDAISERAAETREIVRGSGTTSSIG